MRGFIYFKASVFLYLKSVKTWVAPRNSRPNAGVGFIFLSNFQIITINKISSKEGIIYEENLSYGSWPHLKVNEILSLISRLEIKRRILYVKSI